MNAVERAHRAVAFLEILQAAAGKKGLQVRGPFRLPVMEAYRFELRITHEGYGLECFDEDGDPYLMPAKSAYALDVSDGALKKGLSDEFFKRHYADIAILDFLAWVEDTDYLSKFKKVGDK